MPVINMLKGLPASGKSTLALEMVREEKVKRVSKDALRAMLHGGEYSLETEVFVLDVRNAIVELALRKGFDVVIDDTNLNPAHQEQLRFLADSLGAQFNVIEINTPLDECIRRDKERFNPVGEAVIRGMYEKYLTASVEANIRQSAISVICDRCGKTVKGIIVPGIATSGFYDTTGSWAKYADPHEKIVCDACMWSDPRYQADYGTHSANQPAPPEPIQL